MRSRPATRMCLLVLASAIAVDLAVAADLIVPSTQTRSISGSAYAEDFSSGPFDDQQSDAAVDFSPFSTARSADAQADTAIGSGGGQQTSSILPDRILATGSTFASAETWEFGATADASALNLVRVDFQLTADSSFTLQGELAAFDSAISEISLRENGIEIFGAIIFGPATTAPIDESGSLAAGSYQLEIRTEGSVFGSDFDPAYSSGSFDVAFQVMEAPSPGGEVPDGDDVAGAQPLVLGKLPGGGVRLDWSSSCRPADDDFSVYEGQLGDPTSLMPVTCSTAGVSAWDLTPAFAGAIYVVVPTDGSTEGSYGDTSLDVERAPSAAACRPQLLGAPVCP